MGYNLRIIIALILVIPFTVVAQEQGIDPNQYLILNGPIQEDSSFEPSGVAWDRLTRRYIIFNDKDDEPPIYIYGYDEKSEELKLIENLSIQQNNSGTIEVKKIEDASASLDREGVVYAVTSCDRDDKPYNVLIRISLNQAGKSVFEEMPSFREAIKKLKELLDVSYIKIEALALSPVDKYLYFGVREIGDSYKYPKRVVMIWRLEFKKMSKRPKKIFEMNTQGILGRGEGISSLEYDPVRKRYLMLTSFEKEGNSKDDVGSHLWAIDREYLEQEHGKIFKKAELLSSFSHKAEGVSIDGQGRILVIFDDDSYRKEKDEKKAQKRNQFNIMKNQAHYLLMK